MLDAPSRYGLLIVLTLLPGVSFIVTNFSLQITYSDFPLYEMIDQHRLLEPTILDGLDNLKVCCVLYWTAL